MRADSVLYSSDRTDWETPQSLFDELDREFHFTLDAASTDRNAKCKHHYTQDDDALEQSWGGETVFCNPPYGRDVAKWVRKAYEESRKPDTTVVLLIASRTDTAAFHDYIYGKAEVRFIRGRLCFELGGILIGRAPFPSLIAIYRNGVE